jgi:EAL domain-containing protein (putative c-di-GMP-specific phosphodiesterase class I)
MSQDRCPFCSVGPAHSAGTLLAHAADAALASRIADILHCAKIGHSREGSFVSIAAETAELKRIVVALLRNTLTTVEQRLIRIGKPHLAEIFNAPNLEKYADIMNTDWFDRALARDEFSIFYQPIVNLQGSGTVAYECLIRLEADRVYNGAEIISAATLRGNILGFDAYARGKAIRSAAQGSQTGKKVFINFFPSAMYDPERCMEGTLEAVRKSSLEPSDVVFEVIESDQMTDPDHTRRICEYLRQHGFRYAIDDLGAGTNDLEMIELLRPDYVKIDKTVIWNRDEPASQELIRLTVAIARRVGAEVIAEGIESPRIATDIRQMGIHLMQGYFFGKPAPVMREETNFSGIADLARLSGAVTSSSAPREQTVPVPASASHTRDTRS